MTPTIAIPAAPELEEVADKHWSIEEYHQLIELGALQNQKVQLIFGRIVQISPQKSPHAMAIGLCQRYLDRAFGPAFWVRVQLPMTLNDDSEPEPDVCVVQGSPRDFVEHPKTALLVIEISESTYRFEKKVKGRMYAANQISEYWLIDMVKRQIEISRQPNGEAYASVMVHAADAIIAPLAVPDRSIRVADLLP